MQPTDKRHCFGDAGDKELKDTGEKRSFSTIRKYYHISRREISYLKFILEAYDGIAVLTTVDSFKGLVFLTVAPGCQKEVDQVLKDLANDIMIREIDPETVVAHGDECFSTSG